MRSAEDRITKQRYRQTKPQCYKHTKTAPSVTAGSIQYTASKIITKSYNELRHEAQRQETTSSVHELDRYYIKRNYTYYQNSRSRSLRISTKNPEEDTLDSKRPTKRLRDSITSQKYNG